MELSRTGEAASIPFLLKEVRTLSQHLLNHRFGDSAFKQGKCRIRKKIFVNDSNLRLDCFF